MEKKIEGKALNWMTRKMNLFGCHDAIDSSLEGSEKKIRASLERESPPVCRPLSFLLVVFRPDFIPSASSYSSSLEMK